MDAFRETTVLWDQIKTFVKSAGPGVVTELREGKILFEDKVPPILAKHFLGRIVGLERI